MAGECGAQAVRCEAFGSVAASLAQLVAVVEGLPWGAAVEGYALPVMLPRFASVPAGCSGASAPRPPAVQPQAKADQQHPQSADGPLLTRVGRGAVSQLHRLVRQPL